MNKASDESTHPQEASKGIGNLLKAVMLAASALAWLIGTRTPTATAPPPPGNAIGPENAQRAYFRWQVAILQRLLTRRRFLTHTHPYRSDDDDKSSRTPDIAESRVPNLCLAG